MTPLSKHLGRAVQLLAPLMNPVVARAALKRSRSATRRADLGRAVPWFGGNNIVGVLVTRKTSGKDRTRGELSLQFLVRRKLAKSRLADDELIPPTLRLNSIGRDLLTDVQECRSLPAPHGFPSVRPVAPGSSIGHPRSPGGTLGLIVSKGGKPHYLSCAHVLAPGGSRWSSIGDKIEQPADVFNEDPNNVIGMLAGFTELDPAAAANSTDAAIVECNEIRFDGTVPGIGVPTDALDWAASDFTDHSMVVVRSGVVSGLVSGNIDGFGAAQITYADIGQVIVSDLVIYTAGGEGGDSGAGVFVQAQKTVAGIHVGRLDDSRSVFTPIQSVFDALGVTLWKETEQ